MKDKKSTKHSHIVCEDPKAKFYNQWQQDPEFDDQWLTLQDSAEEENIMSLVFYDRSWESAEVEEE